MPTSAFARVRSPRGSRPGSARPDSAGGAPGTPRGILKNGSGARHASAGGAPPASDGGRPASSGGGGGLRSSLRRVNTPGALLLSSGASGGAEGGGRAPDGAANVGSDPAEGGATRTPSSCAGSSTCTPDGTITSGGGSGGVRCSIKRIKTPGVLQLEPVSAAGAQLATAGARGAASPAPGDEEVLRLDSLRGSAAGSPQPGAAPAPLPAKLPLPPWKAQGGGGAAGGGERGSAALAARGGGTGAASWDVDALEAELHELATSLRL